MLFFLYPQKTTQEQEEFDRQYDRYIQDREKLVAQHVSQPFADMIDKSIQERYANLKPYFGNVDSVLEVGCEKGSFLDLLRGDITELSGVDSCPEYREIIKKKGYDNFLYIDEIPLERKYERICFFSLLEHILDPFSFLERLRNHLGDGGLMVAEVPSASEPLLSLYDNSSFKHFYFQSMHPYVYSRKALEILCGKCGLKLKEVLFKQRYGLPNHLQWLKSGIPGGNPAFDELFSQELRMAYIDNLEQKGFTDTMYLIIGNV